MSLPTLPLLTWAQFYTLLLEKYIPCTLHDGNKDEFSSFEKGSISVTSFKAKFHTLCHSPTLFLGIKEESIQFYMKGLRSDVQVLSMYNTLKRKTFNEVYDYVKKL